MCTATWLMSGDGYELFCNRDEKRSRQPALPPTRQCCNGVAFIAPRDADAGGSWIGVNEFALSLCLLNLYPAAAPQPKFPISRGILLTSLMDCRSQAEIARRLNTILFKRFKPFLLLVLVPGRRASMHTWDGSLFSGSTEVSPPVTTSSFDPANVIEARRAKFAELQGEAYHMSRDERGGAYSVCMSRDDAQTVSFSRIAVIKERIVFTYRPVGAASPPRPGKEEIATRTSLPRHL
jgi:hypothetical protein